jgi:hypothetical protein
MEDMGATAPQPDPPAGKVNLIHLEPACKLFHRKSLLRPRRTKVAGFAGARFLGPHGGGETPPLRNIRLISTHRRLPHEENYQVFLSVLASSRGEH